MTHQALVLADIPAQIGRIVGVWMVPEEAQLEDRQRDVARIALAQDDPRTGE